MLFRGLMNGGARGRPACGAPERDGLPCHTHILDQERGEGSLGRTAGLCRGQGGRGGRRGEIQETSGESERTREGFWRRDLAKKGGGFISMKGEE